MSAAARIPLNAGQRRQLFLEAGEMLLIDHGTVTLTGSPAWLAEHCVFPARRLGAGECWQAPQSGWISLEADRCAQLRHAPVAAPAFSWPWLLSHLSRMFVPA